MSMADELAKLQQLRASAAAMCGTNNADDQFPAPGRIFCTSSDGGGC